MIKFTRFNRQELCINPDLIKSAEAIPDTIITLTTGERLYVRESVEEVVARFVEYQNAIRQQRAQGILAPLSHDGAMADDSSAEQQAPQPAASPAEER